MQDTIGNVKTYKQYTCGSCACVCVDYQLQEKRIRKLCYTMAAHAGVFCLFNKSNDSVAVHRKEGAEGVECRRDANKRIDTILIVCTFTNRIPFMVGGGN